MRIRLHLVPCIVCGRTRGVLYVGEYVDHAGGKCLLVPYKPNVQHRFRVVHHAEKRSVA